MLSSSPTTVPPQSSSCERPVLGNQNRRKVPAIRIRQPPRSAVVNTKKNVAYFASGVLW